MRRLVSALAVTALVCLAPACSSERDDGRDTDTDAGSTEGTDAGQTDAGSRDAGQTPDAGQRDAGETTEPDAGFQFDGGTIECAQAGSCTETECEDISGTYATCVECPVVGKQGPLEAVVTRVGETCEFQAVTQQGTNSACATACAGPAGAFNTTISASGFSLNCTGTLANGTATTTCTPACTLTWLPAGTTVCP